MEEGLLEGLLGSTFKKDLQGVLKKFTDQIGVELKDLPGQLEEGFDINSSKYNYSVDELIWTRPKLTQKYFDDMVTILGHTPTHFYGAEHRGKAVKTSSWIDIDTGAAYGGSPMLLRLDDMGEFYV